MSILSRVKKELRNRFIKWMDPETGLWRAGSYYPTDSGVNVSADSAMRVTAVYACVRILSWTLASLPLPIYRRLQPRGKERVPEHQLYTILHDEPNPEQTSFQFRSLIMAHALLWGNGYAEIETDTQGNIIALWPIPPWLTEPMKTKEKALYYEVTLADGTKVNIPGYRMFHIMCIGTDGKSGLSSISVARQAIGLTLAAEEYGTRFFGQGANVGGVAMHPGKLSEEVYQRLKSDLEEKYKGLGKTHRVLLLEEGMKYERTGIPPDDAQFLETRRFQIADIARLYGVPSYLINDTERTTSWGTGIEQMGIGLVVYTLRPWLVNWEQEIRRKLLLRSPDYFAEFLIDGLLRGDIAARYAAYAIGRNGGWLSADDIREMENMNPLPDGQGKVYLSPLNMAPAGKNPPAPTNPLKLPSLEAQDDEGEPMSPADDRMRIVGGFRLVIADAVKRILKREEADVMRQVRKLDAQAFDGWLRHFYSEHVDYFQRQLTAVVQAMSESAALQPGFGLGILAQRHAERSLSEISTAIKKADDEGENIPETLQKQFNSWSSFRVEELTSAIMQFSIEGRASI